MTPIRWNEEAAGRGVGRVICRLARGQACVGHSSPAIAREFYISKPAIAADVAHVLEELSGADGERRSNTWGI